MDEISDLIKKTKEEIYSENSVLELVHPSINDYARGVIAGRIEMLNFIERELGSKSEEKNKNNSLLK